MSFIMVTFHILVLAIGVSNHPLLKGICMKLLPIFFIRVNSTFWSKPQCQEAPTFARELYERSG